MEIFLKKKLIKKLMHPNTFTLVRVVVVPFLLLLMLDSGFWSSFFATVIFCIASITDFFDGFLARKFGLVSNFGKIMDPLADKILISSAFVMLVEQGRVSGWIVCVIVGRELAVTGLRNIMTDNNVDVSASMLAKWKTGFQIAALIPLIYNYRFLGMNMALVGTYLLWIALALTILSGLDYFYKSRRFFKN